MTERDTTKQSSDSARWEHFAHIADIGVRGVGSTVEEAFEQGAMALAAVTVELETVNPQDAVDIRCDASDVELLFADWLNALVFEGATRKMIFARFQVRITDGHLEGTAWGEKIDRARHCPGVEVKGATYTELAVRKEAGGRWIAQCVVDV
jgi:tRNA nucleotidyltransferase (CCA-adding enzyme)